MGCFYETTGQKKCVCVNCGNGDLETMGNVAGRDPAKMLARGSAVTS